jgi:hypothetical protein
VLSVEERLSAEDLPSAEALLVLLEALLKALLQPPVL